MITDELSIMQREAEPPKYFAGFLNDHREFGADYVSHHVEPKSGHDRGRGGLLERRSQSSAQSLGLLVGRVLVPPLRARASVSLTLTDGRAAYVLASAGSWVRLEPVMADPARALAGHRPQGRRDSLLPPNNAGGRC
jgi:hypothetical protein